MHIPFETHAGWHLLSGIIAILLIFGGAFFLLWFYLWYQNRLGARGRSDIHQDPSDRDTSRVLLPLQLQACERLVLFLERIHPSNLLMRLNDPDLTSLQMQALLVRTIREEFEHNLSQQLYVSNQTWEMIRNAKEETVSMINQASSKTRDGASSGDLVKLIVESTLEKRKLTSELALDEIKREMQQWFLPSPGQKGSRPDFSRRQ